MSLNAYLVVSLFSFQLMSCGFFQKDDDNISPSAGPGNQEVFALTGTEVTDVTGDQVASFVNGSHGLIEKANLEAIVTNLHASASTISRDATPTANFIACLKQKMNDTPLQVTADTISFNFDFDFIAVCDREEKPTDLVGEVKNTMKASVTVGCAGGNIGGFKGKFVKDLGAQDVLKNLCRDSGDSKILSRKVSYEATVDARKTTKVKNGTEFEVNFVSSVFSNASLKAQNGSPCNLLVVNETTSRLDSCRAVSQSKTFNAHPKYESNSPNEKTQPHVVVLQSVITVNNAVWENDAKYYTSADTTFLYNGWNGTVTYRNGWAAPTWKATFKSSERGGTYGVNTPAVTTPPAAANEKPDNDSTIPAEQASVPPPVSTEDPEAGNN